MSQVLYRKYRPKIFAEVIGQEHITETLKNQIKTGRVVHSYIFTGSRGIGKTTVARLLAKSLNCAGRSAEDPEPCNECDSCKAINLGNALDVVEIDAASHTGVQDVRDRIIENTRFAPVGAKFKIFIIDEAHMLSASAFNALLKTLEEPPGYIVFILATTEIHKIPATILSRCQRFDFKKPNIAQIIERLGRIAKAENIKADKCVFERIAYLAEGGLRDAESLLGQILGLGVKKITEEDADIVLPKSDSALALGFLETLSKKDGREAMLGTQKLLETGISLKHFLDNVIELARKTLFSKITGREDGFLPHETNKKLSEMAQILPQRELVRILDILLARREEINNFDIPSLPLELAVAEICGEEYQENKETIKQENKKEKTAGADCLNSGSGDLSEIESKWGEMLEKIKEHNHSLPFVLNTAKPIFFDGKKLIIGLKYNLHKEKLEDLRNRSILTNVLKSVYNSGIEFETMVDENLAVDAESEDEVDVASEFGN